MVHLNLAALAHSIQLRLRTPSRHNAARHRAARPRPSFRPGLEALEDRALPSTSPVLPGVHAFVGEVGHHHHHHHHAPSVALTTPTAGAAVGQTVTITGQLENAGHRWPVVVVQEVGAGNPWVVQPEVVTVNADGTFSAQISIGDASTPPGTSFKIEVFLASNKHEATHRFAPGTTLHHLPRDLTTSPAVVVTTVTAPPPGHKGGA